MSEVKIPAGEKTILGHPRGLVVLFFTEMWERFSYYGMRALLTLYLVQHFLFSDEKSSSIYGAYIALVYVMSIIGGSLSDKYLGQRKAVTFGAILLVLGHTGMAFEGSGSQEFIKFNNAEYAMEDEGRDRFRQLFIEYNGAPRRLIFDSNTQATLVGHGAGGADLVLAPMDKDGGGDYRVAHNTRSFFQNICNVVKLGCAGEDPSTTLILKNGSYNVITEESEAGSSQYAMINGVRVQFSENTDTALQILTTDTREKPDTETGKLKNLDVLTTIEAGTFSSRNEKQTLYVYILFLSLSFIIAGVGFLKPNISTIVGSLYEKHDVRRDSGFTLFYMGINLGSFLSTWTCGILGIYYGWKWGFGLAGLGMLIGLVTFLKMQPWLEGRAEPPNPAKLKEKVFGPINVEWACYLVGFGIIALAMTLVMHSEIVGSLGAIVGVLMFTYLIVYSFVKLKGRDRSRLWAGAYFAVAQIPFWSLFEQAGSSLTLFTSRLVDTNIFGWDVPTPVFQSLNAGFIFIFAPIVAWLWIWLAKRNWEPSTPVKFAFGVMGVGLGYLALVGGINAAGDGMLTAVLFIFLIYWIHTMAELLLSPVGLSAMTKLAPAQAVGLMMGAWFLYSGLGNSLSGVIAGMAGAETVGGEIVDKVAAKNNYASVFSSVGWIGVVIGLGMLLFAPIVKRWMKEGDVEETADKRASEA